MYKNIPQIKCTLTTGTQRRKIMNKLYVFFLCGMFCTVTMIVQAQTTIPGTNLTWSISGGTLTINGTGGIPNFAATGAPWYNERASITAVVIGEGVASIGENAFRDCGIASLTIPNGVTSIGKHAFEWNQLNSVTIPDSVTSLGIMHFAKIR